MLTYKDIDTGKKALIFGLDDVIFPKRDYLLQVYYLFANLLEYTETVPLANDLTTFFKTAYEHHGEDGLFDRAAEAFGIDAKYKENFDRLHATAQLPLKLLIYEPVYALMKEWNDNAKRLIVLTSGNPVMQLNKLKHMEWKGLDRVVKDYFSEELEAQQTDPCEFLLKDNDLPASQVLYIGALHSNNRLAGGLAIESVDVNLFMPAPEQQKTKLP